MPVTFSRTLDAAFVTATKEIVDALLSMNTSNRAVGKNAVERLVRQIKDGLWVPNNQGVGLSKDGNVLDGQHRLLAMREAGYPPVKFLLVTGLDPNAVATIDIGNKRTHHDTIRLLLNMELNKHVVAAIGYLANARFSSRGSWGLVEAKDRRTAFELVDWIDMYERGISTAFGAMSNPKFFRMPVKAAFIAFAQAMPGEAAEFIRQVEGGEMLTKTMPAYHLRQHLLTHSKGGHSGQVLDFSITVRCINGALKNEVMRMWKITMTQDWHEAVKAGQPYNVNNGGTF